MHVQIGTCPHCGCPIYGKVGDEGSTSDIPYDIKYVCECRHLAAAMAAGCHPAAPPVPVVYPNDNTVEPWPMGPPTTGDPRLVRQEPIIVCNNGEMGSETLAMN